MAQAHHDGGTEHRGGGQGDHRRHRAHVFDDDQFRSFDQFGAANLGEVDRGCESGAGSAGPVSVAPEQERCWGPPFACSAVGFGPELGCNAAGCQAGAHFGPLAIGFARTWQGVAKASPVNPRS